MFDGKANGNKNTSGVDPETKKDQTTQENPENELRGLSKLTHTRIT